MEMLMEAVILAFTLGGIVGAVTALHLNKGMVRIKDKPRIRQHNLRIK